MTYPLYHTFKNVKDTEMKKSENTKLIKKLETLDEESKKAVILLVIEHAKVVDEFVVNIEKIKLPYGMKQIGDDVELNIDKLPNLLKWILWKFLNLSVSER